MRDFCLGSFAAIVSEITEAEVADAPPNVRGVLDDLLAGGAERLTDSDEVVRLATSCRPMKKRSDSEQPVKAVDMVRSIRDAHYERFKDRPIGERIAYYRRRAQAFEEASRRTAAAKHRRTE